MSDDTNDEGLLQEGEVTQETPNLDVAMEVAKAIQRICSGYDTTRATAVAAICVALYQQVNGSMPNDAIDLVRSISDISGAAVLAGDPTRNRVVN